MDQSPNPTATQIAEAIAKGLQKYFCDKEVNLDTCVDATCIFLASLLHELSPNENTAYTNHLLAFQATLEYLNRLYPQTE